MSNIKRLYLNSPWWVINAVMSLDSGDNSSWWNAHLISNLLYTLLWFKSCKISSTVGIGYRSRTTASFALRMSIHRRISEFFLGITTIGDTHILGLSTFSMMSNCCNSSSFLSSFSRRRNGILRIGWMTGFTDSSIGIFSWKSFNFPTPSKHFGNFCFIIAFLSSLTELTLSCGTPIFNIPNDIAVVFPSNACPFSSTT